MNSFITDLQDALVAGLATPPAGGWARPFTIDKGLEEAKDLSDRTRASLYIGVDAWRPDSRGATLALDQCVVPLTLQQRRDWDDAPGLDELLRLGEQLREQLADWHDGPFRVETVAAPLPFDRALLRTPGLCCQRILLDVDVLRTIATAPTPADETAELTKARKAVWAAVNASTFSVAWARKYESDQALEELTLRDPGAHELPALALYWGETKPEWFTNVMQKWPSLLTATAWLPASLATAGELVLQELVAAVFRATISPSTVPVVKKATGHYPELRALRSQLVPFGRSGLRRAVRLDAQFDLTTFFDPLHPGSP